MEAAMREMIENALRWTTLGNLVEGLSYEDARQVVDAVFGPESAERAEVDTIFNVR